jgi:predicted outer membrane protein
VKDAALREMSAMMSAGTGQMFDKMYMDQELATHQQVIDLLNKAHPEHPELERLVAQAMPVLEKHLAAAREVETKLGQPGT